MIHAAPPKPALADRLADRVNPVALKELRQAVNSRFINGMLLTLLAVLLAILIGYAVTLDPAQAATRGDGAWLFGFFQLVLGVVAGLGLPLYVGIRLAVERATATGDLLRMTTLMPWEVVRGKMYAGLTLAGLIASACVPFVVVTWLLRGVDVVTILATLVSMAGLVTLALSLALMVGSSPHGPVMKTIYGLFMLLVTPILLLVLSGLVSTLAFITGRGFITGLLSSLLAFGTISVLFLARAAGWLSPRGASRSRSTRGPSKAWVGRKKLPS
ncbi:hypothetical protein [Phycisphaera mikurensis]|uniref:Hypothetical membrane protein n=1 Tax=Phycisphaera mikurensis (strain NBRC 102666 / KCTC 22515 / FYK2301M01) TaxID=1142394 RepID=I0IHK4_PHYMF|nr:hypothetical protein [Phycisphaera mikurensis]MBB6440987.1 hypothetical protein [Phycisphaera mikurensis]BAM04742.1 hypothetical membrane protein [Phycisphaera mikurensis NBRC 102666]